VPQPLIVDTQLRWHAYLGDWKQHRGITPKKHLNKSSSFTNMIE
jgi:hypothetical protein